MFYQTVLSDIPPILSDFILRNYRNVSISRVSSDQKSDAPPRCFPTLTIDFVFTKINSYNFEITSGDHFSCAVYINSVEFHYLILIVVQGSRYQTFRNVLLRKLLYYFKYCSKLIVSYQGSISPVPFM